MNEKFIRFISKNTIFNNKNQTQFPCDLLKDYNTTNNELSIFLLDQYFLDRVCAHFCLMKNRFGKPGKLDYIMFEKRNFENNVDKNIKIEHAPNQILCGDLGIKHLHYNIINLETKNINSLLNFFNTQTKTSVSEKDVKKYIEMSITNNNLTFSTDNMKFPKEKNHIIGNGFLNYVVDYFPNIKNPTYN